MGGVVIYLSNFFFLYHFRFSYPSGLQAARPSLGGEVIYLSSFFFFFCLYHFSLFSSSGLHEARPRLGGEVIYFRLLRNLDDLDD